MGTNRASQTNPATVNYHDAMRDAGETKDERPPKGTSLELTEMTIGEGDPGLG
jgi:hypothetical protein